MVEGMGDDVSIKGVAQITVEPGADVPVDRLQFDEYQRQTIDETNQVGAAIVVGRAQPGDPEFAHHQKAIVCRLTEIDHPGLRVTQCTLRIAIAHRHTVADQPVKSLIVLEQGARIIMVRQLGHRLVYRRRRQRRVELYQCGPQIEYQHHLALAGTAQRAVGTEGLLVPGIDALPAQHLFQVIGKGCLNQAVFAVDVGVGHALAHQLT